ncbi:MAG TPA: 50S ribosomal protein L11 methyltransferase [Candidatus Methanoperedens sp.]|nr:50S ribosomal protein L11 methyltransferase [Candidatus Methanoperedens sp.]
MASAPADPFAHRPRRTWRRVTVEVPAALADAAADLLVEASGAGVEIAPAAPDGEGGERERITAYLAGDAGAEQGEVALRRDLAALAARAGGGEMTVRGEPLLEEDWGAGWKEHFHPFRAAPHLLVKPTWEECTLAPGDAVIEMDPGMAFGTGLHASTRLALALLEEHCVAAVPRRMLDLGTGTGILALAAALRGAGEVLAVDNDPDAVAAARHNVARNRLDGRARVLGDDLAALAGPFDLIAANITADVLLALAPLIVARCAAGGRLVLAGVLAGAQEQEVRAGYERLGLVCEDARAEGEWAALLLRAPAEEIFEIVDAGGRVIGRAPRSACHRDPALIHRVSHVLVVAGDGRIYLQRRPLGKDVQPGKWDTSVGGHLEIGEDHETGAHREMLEELGLAGALRPLYRYLWRSECETELVATFLHEAREEPRPRPGEVDEGRWFTPAEAAALVERGDATPNLAEELRRLAAAGILPQCGE